MGTRPRIKRTSEKVYAVSGNKSIYRTERKVVATGLMVAFIWGMTDRPVTFTREEVATFTPEVQKMFRPQFI